MSHLAYMSHVSQCVMFRLDFDLGSLLMSNLQPIESYSFIALIYLGIAQKDAFLSFIIQFLRIWSGMCAYYYVYVNHDIWS